MKMKSCETSNPLNPRNRVLLICGQTQKKQATCLWKTYGTICKCASLKGVGESPFFYKVWSVWGFGRCTKDYNVNVMGLWKSMKHLL